MSPSDVAMVGSALNSPPRRIAARPAPLASLAGTSMSDRFCFWRGRSGRRYVFSVYNRIGNDSKPPSYAEAVVIEAERQADGSRSVVRLGYTGALPDLLTTSWKRQASQGAATETHVHLLAGSIAERRALLLDLCDHA